MWVKSSPLKTIGKLAFSKTRECSTEWVELFLRRSIKFTALVLSRLVCNKGKKLKKCRHSLPCLIRLNGRSAPLYATQLDNLSWLPLYGGCKKCLHGDGLVATTINTEPKTKHAAVNTTKFIIDKTRKHAQLLCSNNHDVKQ